MAKFKSRPTTIEATQWFPGIEVSGVYRFEFGDPAFARHYVVTIHGQRAYLSPGDWVVTELDGKHHYPIKPEIFAVRWEPVQEEG